MSHSNANFFFLSFLNFFIDLNKQAVIYKAKSIKRIQINSKGIYLKPSLKVTVIL